MLNYAPDSLPSPQYSYKSLLFAGGVLFGSRAVGYYTDASDYDIAILRSNFFNMYNKDTYAHSPEKDIGNYMTVYPPNGCTLVQVLGIRTNIRLDILLMNSQDDLDVIREAVTDTKQVLRKDKCKRSKVRRVQIYNDELLKRGFHTLRPLNHVLIELRQVILSKFRRLSLKGNK